MIIRENLIINNTEFTRTFSNSGFLIMRDNVKYTEALDLASLNRVYTETEERIEGYTEEATEEDYISALEQLGVYAYA